jgi:hypothetical protein
MDVRTQVEAAANLLSAIMMLFTQNGLPVSDHICLFGKLMQEIW